MYTFVFPNLKKINSPNIYILLIMNVHAIHVFDSACQMLIGTQ